MTASLAAFAARLLSLLLPPVIPPPASLWGFLAALTVLGITGSGWVPYGCLGMPGDSAEDEEGGRAP